MLKLFQAGSDDLMLKAQKFLYANGSGHPPTAIDLDKSLLNDLLFNQSPAKVLFNVAFLYFVQHEILCSLDVIFF